MILSRLALGVALLALIGLIGVLMWLTRTYINGMPIPIVFLEMTPVSKVLLFPAVLIALAGVVIGLISLTSRPSGQSHTNPAEILLWLTGAGSVAFAFLAAAYVELNVQSAIAAVGPVSFAVTAPARAEGLLCLIIGLSGAIPSLLILQILEGRRRRAAGIRGA